MRSGVRIGVDVGKVRIGIARTDFHGMLATPVETVARGGGDVARILAIAE
ncbi:MAG TPA: Holliday junction resolvase RuvX, partial [Glaciihabitans sp.]|nr:Holliday junction resolvase RuvX [Glaciihabitans sp.]